MVVSASKLTKRFIDIGDEDMGMQADSNDCHKGIKSLRLRKGYSLTEAATYIGVTEGELNNYEMNPGEMPISIAVKLLNLYRVEFKFVCFHKCSRIP